MDVNETRARSEIESLKRLLKEREDDHSKEVGELRENQREQIKSLDENQSENVQRLRKSNEEQLDSSRKKFDKAMDNANDNFQSTLAEERRDSYDKFGRMNHENARERAAENMIRSKQVKDLIDSQKTDTDDQHRYNNERYLELRDFFEKQNRALKDRYDSKIGALTQANDKALAENAQTTRDKSDQYIRRMNGELANEKLGGALRYKKLADENKSYNESLKEAWQQRENQLVNERTADTTHLGRGNAKTFEEYRKRSADQLEKAIADQHYFQEKSERENADKLVASEQQHQRKLQDMASEYRKSENALKFDAAASKERANLKESMDERRHQQDVFLNGEAIRKSDALSAELQKEKYSNQVRDLDEKFQKQMQDNSLSAQKTLNEQAMRTNDTVGQLQEKKRYETGELAMRHSQEKANLIRTYETRQAELDDLKNRQMSAQKEYHGKEIKEVRNAANRQVASNNRDNQARLFMLQQRFENATNEYEAHRKSDKIESEYQDRERAKRINAAYSRSMQANKETFDNETETLRQDALVQQAKIRAQDDHEKRMQLLDLQTKNRQLLLSFEARMNELKDAHDAEMVKIKQEAEKQTRDVVRKIQLQSDIERMNHSQEIDSRERQMKDKLRLQEEAFKEQIEKLKRTHELATKKS